MDRLVQKQRDGLYRLDSNKAFLQDGLGKLYEYEDTGLTPEEIQNDIRVYTELWEEKLSDKQKELDEAINRANQFSSELFDYRQAEEQGLLIKLPCRIDDTVYWVSHFRSGVNYGTITAVKKSRFGIDLELCNCDGALFWMEYEKVFLTREAAKEALKGGSL